MLYLFLLTFIIIIFSTVFQDISDDELTPSPSPARADMFTPKLDEGTKHLIIFLN